MLSKNAQVKPYRRDVYVEGGDHTAGVLNVTTDSTDHASATGAITATCPLGLRVIVRVD